MKKAGIIGIVAVVLLVAAAAWAFDDAVTGGVIVKGNLINIGAGEGKMVSPSDKERENLRLVISEKDGKYYWVSNQNKILVKIEKVLIDEKKTYGNENQKYTIFLNPDGEGQIIIRHAEANGCTDITPTNYKEYRLNNTGGLKSYTGITEPYPYPEGGWCSEW